MTTTTCDPFFHMDISKIICEFRMAGVDSDAILRAHRDNIEAVTSANKLAIEGMQIVARCQTEILRSFFEYAGCSMTSALNENSEDNFDIMNKMLEAVLIEIKNMSDIVANANLVFSNGIGERFDRCNNLYKTRLRIKGDQCDCSDV